MKSLVVSMAKLLSQWSPSKAAIDLIKLNGLDDDHINKSVDYLKNKTDLENIDDIKGYDNWNSFFIVFCIKATSESGEEN